MNIARFTAACAIATLAAVAPALAQTAAPSPQPSSAPSPASPAPAPQASPVSSAAAAANLAKARAEFEAWQNAKIDLSRYIPEAATQFTGAAVKSISDTYLKPLGAVKTFTQIRVVTTPAAVIYVYHSVCANGAMDQAISWNDAGKVQFIRFVPPAS